MPGVIILSARDVSELLDIRSCVEAVEEALRLLGRGAVGAPGILGMHVEGGGFHVKAAAMRTRRHWFAAKTNANFPDNPERRGLPSIQGLLLLFDADSGTPLAVMDSGAVTELRTAAATAVAARHLSRPDSSVVTLIGCGAQGASQLRALAVVRRLERVNLFDLDGGRARALARVMSEELSIPVDVGSDLGSALQASDICVTCTPARTPVLERALVRPGTFVAAVGADSPHKHEIAPDLMAASVVVVDSLAQCREMGDLHHALVAGAMREEDVRAELGAVVAGTAVGRAADDDIVVFDSTGMGLQDVAAASVAYEEAVTRRRGLEVGLRA